MLDDQTNGGGVDLSEPVLAAGETLDKARNAKNKRKQSVASCKTNKKKRK